MTGVAAESACCKRRAVCVGWLPPAPELLGLRRLAKGGIVLVLFAMDANISVTMVCTWAITSLGVPAAAVAAEVALELPEPDPLE